MIGSAYGFRTRFSALKGQRPSPRSPMRQKIYDALLIKILRNHFKNVVIFGNDFDFLFNRVNDI